MLRRQAPVNPPQPVLSTASPLIARTRTALRRDAAAVSSKHRKGAGAALVQAPIHNPGPPRPACPATQRCPAAQRLPRPAEPSLLVLGITLNDAWSIGVEFAQNGFVWCAPDAVPRLVLLR